MKLGRPKKYNEKLINKGLALPESLEAYLKDLSEEKNTSFNELIISYIISANKDLQSQILNNMKEIQESISNDIKVNKDLLSKLKNTNLKFDLFDKIEPDERITKYVRTQKEKIVKMILNGHTTLNDIVDIIYNELEGILIKKGNYIKKRNMTKLLIKQEILIIKGAINE